MRSFLHRTKVLVATIFFFAVPFLVSAATLNVSPSAGTYTVGKTFPITVNVSSASQSVNAVSGTLNFPTDELQVVSVSKTGSVLSLWVQDPSFSNSAGTVSFEGVVPNPGFQGSNGRVVTVNFKVIAKGVATVKLSNGSVLANDGSGTNVLDTLNNANFTLNSATVSAPVPTPVESAPVNAPSFTITALPSSNPADSEPRFSFVVSNSSAPIDHYTIQIDGGTPGTWQDDGSGVYQTPSLEPGKHTLSVQAYDTAGNFIPASTSFTIAVATPQAKIAPTVSVSSWFQAFSSSLTFYLALTIPILALLFLFFYLIMHGAHKVRMSKSKFQRELHDVERLVDKAFVLLKEDVEDSIRLLERTRSKRKLTQEEDRLIERLRQNLRDADTVIHDQVRKVEDSL